jgi:protein N-terminal methyltransferase
VAGLQEWIPEPARYDVIWIQWVIGHLWDADFVQFFRRCVVGLKPGGVIVLKDNCAVGWSFVVDRSDRSVARCREYLDTLFGFAQLRVVAESRQTDFPPELYPVHMIALEPIT